MKGFTFLARDSGKDMDPPICFLGLILVVLILLGQSLEPPTIPIVYHHLLFALINPQRPLPLALEFEHHILDSTSALVLPCVLNPRFRYRALYNLFLHFETCIRFR